MNKSESIKELAIALCKFQSSIGTVKKTNVNPFLKSSYASLDDILSVIRKPLTDNGLSFVQFPKARYSLETTLMHISGEWISESYEMKPTTESPQGAGSVITYQRRYALGAILGLNIAEDDDAEIASIPLKLTEKPELKPGTQLWNNAVDYIKEGKSIDNIKDKYMLSAVDEKILIGLTK